MGLNEEIDLAILGSFPPPFGGVATHVARLSRILLEDGHRFRVYNAVSESEQPDYVSSVVGDRHRWLLKFFAKHRAKTVLLMSDRWPTWVLGAWASRLRGFRLVVRLRNSKLIDLHRSKPHVAGFVFKSLKYCAGIVCVNDELRRLCIEVGGLDPDKVLRIPGFLSPSNQELGDTHLDPKSQSFIEVGSPLIAANGKFNRYEGIDLYGLDMMVELARRLVADYPNLRIIVCFWDHKDEDDAELKRLEADIRDSGLEDNIYFRTRPGLFVPVLKHAHLFVRPTATDGDANSIREALYLGIPCAASNVVERPPGCEIFGNRDHNDFEKTVRKLLAKKKSSSPSQESIKPTVYLKMLLPQGY